MPQTENDKNGLAKFFSDYFGNFGKFFIVNILFNVPLLIFGGLAFLLSHLTGTINIFVWFLLIPLMSPFFAGSFYICRKIATDQPVNPVRDFFKGLKDNWKYFLINSIILYAIVSGLWVTYGFYRDNLGNPMIIAALVFSVIFTLYFAFMEFLIPVMSVSVELKFIEILKNSVVLALGGFVNNLKTTLSLMFVFSVIFTLIQFTGNIILGLIITGILLIVILPLFCIYIVTFNSYKTVEKFVIKPYAEEHAEETRQQEREEAVSELDEDELRKLADGNPDEFVFLNGRMLKRSAIQNMLNNKKK